MVGAVWCGGEGVVVELELAGAIAQLGAAGLIGLMWLSERRAATERDRQLTEQHERIKRDRTELTVLVSVLEANTRALASLEAGQGRLIAALEHRWSDTGGGGRCPSEHQAGPVSADGSSATR